MVGAKKKDDALFADNRAHTEMEAAEFGAVYQCGILGVYHKTNQSEVYQIASANLPRSFFVGVSFLAYASIGQNRERRFELRWWCAAV